MTSVQKAFGTITDDLITEHNRRKKDMRVGSSKWLLNPRGNRSDRWDILVASLLVVLMVTMPLSFGFRVRRPFFLTPDTTVVSPPLAAAAHAAASAVDFAVASAVPSILPPLLPSILPPLLPSRRQIFSKRLQGLDIFSDVVFIADVIKHLWVSHAGRAGGR